MLQRCAILLAWLFAALLAPAQAAHAAQRTFVSTSGSDANTASNCANSSPCRGFAAALTVTDAGGEIIVLGSGGYGPVSIDKSVSVIAPEGVYAGVTVFSGTGINIAGSGIDVTLRGLTINGLGGSYGVSLSLGSSLLIDRCVFTNLFNGIYFSAAAKLRIVDSIFRKNAYGAEVRGGAAGSVVRSYFYDNGYGVYVAATAGETLVDVEKSVAGGNSTAGFFVSAGGGGTARLTATDSAVHHNLYGVYALSLGGTVSATVANSYLTHNTSAGARVEGAGAILVASGNTVTRNATGLVQTSGVLKSDGTNSVQENLADFSGSITGFSRL